VRCPDSDLDLLSAGSLDSGSAYASGETGFDAVPRSSHLGSVGLKQETEFGFSATESDRKKGMIFRRRGAGGLRRISLGVRKPSKGFGLDPCIFS
jgi:hypothetical protein